MKKNELADSFFQIHLETIKTRFPGLMSTPENAAAVAQIVKEVTDSCEVYVRTMIVTETMLGVGQFLQEDLNQLVQMPLEKFPGSFQEILLSDPRSALVAFAEATYMMVTDALAILLAGGEMPPLKPLNEEVSVPLKKALPEEAPNPRLTEKSPTWITWTSREKGQA